MYSANSIDNGGFDELLSRLGGKLVPVYVGRLRSLPGTPIPANQVRYGITSSLLQPGELELWNSWQYWLEDDNLLALPDARAVREVNQRLNKLNILLASRTHFPQGKRQEMKREREMLISYLQTGSREEGSLQSLHRDYRYLKTLFSRFALRLRKHSPEAADYFLSHLQTGLYFMWIPDV